MSRTSAPKGSGLSTAIGTAASLASLFSDRRVKNSIKHIATTSDGLKLYSFKYNGYDTVHTGLIAQEVAGVYPDAVSEVGGVLCVDYGKALKYSGMEAA